MSQITLEVQLAKGRQYLGAGLSSDSTHIFSFQILSSEKLHFGQNIRPEEIDRYVRKPCCKNFYNSV